MRISKLAAAGLLLANTTCPAGGLPPSSGGSWIGNAIVSFAGSTEQAYLNLAKDQSGVRAVLIALATPPPTASPS